MTITWQLTFPNTFASSRFLCFGSETKNSSPKAVTQPRYPRTKFLHSSGSRVFTVTQCGTAPNSHDSHALGLTVAVIPMPTYRDGRGMLGIQLAKKVWAMNEMTFRNGIFLYGKDARTIMADNIYWVILTENFSAVAVVIPLYLQHLHQNFKG